MKITSLLLIFVNIWLAGLPVAAQSRKKAEKAPAGFNQTKKTPATFDDPALVKRYQEMILPESLASRLYFLASDFFEGRETGTRGQHSAAQYLASQYRWLGLAPKGTVKPADPFSPAAYFQPFSLYQVTPKETRLEVTVNGAKVANSVFSAEKHDDLAYYSWGTPTNTGGGVVFAGYGIADDRLGFNDYAALAAKGISINDKWLLMLSDEPAADAATSLLPTADHKLSNWTTGYLEKRMARFKAGRPKGVLVVTDLSPRNKNSFAENAANASLNIRPPGTLATEQAEDVPPMYAVSAKLANQILAPSGQKIEDLKRQIDTGLKPNVFEIKNVMVSSTVEHAKPVETENVLAFIEGSDPKLKDEIVIFSSHYDHLGLNPLLIGDQIFNGAADDGSGAVASLELARAFMEAKRDGYGPRRSILFMNTAGEEKGILGSYYYAEKEPLIPLEKTVADINMDGIGGIDLKHPTGSKNYIYIAGAPGLSDELIEINKRIKTVTGNSLDLTDGNGKGFSSDSTSFESRLVPFIYYSTGLTEHYHTTRDEADTIDYDHMTRVTQLIFATAWQIANQDARISSVDRSKLVLAGYVCRPCQLACDKETFDHPGNCPICGMNLVPKYVVKK